MILNPAPPTPFNLTCECEHVLEIIQALGGANTSMLIAPFGMIALLSMAYVGGGYSSLLEIMKFETCGKPLTFRNST
jgi:hypothetical protein